MRYILTLMLSFILMTGNGVSIPLAGSVRKTGLNASGTAGFTENKGQVQNKDGGIDRDVKFIYDRDGFRLVLRTNGFSYEAYSLEAVPEICEADGLPSRSKQHILKVHRIDIRFAGGNESPQILKGRILPGFRNYYNVNPYVSGVFSYQSVAYKNIYPGIDIVFRIENDRPKYDLVLHPGSDPDDIKVICEGADGIMLNEAGDLLLSMSLGIITETIPHSYLQEEGAPVEVNYRLKDGAVGFRTGTYDRKKTLVIDPVPMLKLEASIGAGYTGSYNMIKTDRQNNIVIAGTSSSLGNVATPGAHQTSVAGASDVYIAKFDPNGNLQWATYYGGSSVDSPQDLYTDTRDNILIAGYTQSPNNISTPGAHQTLYVSHNSGNTDGFIAKFTSGGALVWGTYYGDEIVQDFVAGICTDRDDNVIVTGYTGAQGYSSLTTPGAFQTQRTGGFFSAFIAKFSSEGKRQWGTFYGNDSDGQTVCTDSQNNIIIAGSAGPGGIMPSASAFQTVMGGGARDAFIAKFTPSGERIWGTFYGGAGTEGDIPHFSWSNSGICTDSKDNVILTGYTSSNNGIASPGSFKTFLEGTEDCFIAKFNSDGMRSWGTYYGGPGDDVGQNVSADQCNNIIVSGITNSLTGIADSASAYQVSYGGPADHFFPSDVFVAKFTGGGSRIWGTYYGTSDRENQVSSITDSRNNILSAVSRLTDTINQVILVKFYDDSTSFPPPLEASGPATICPGDSVEISTPPALRYLWVTGDTTQSITVKEEGVYYATLTYPDGCVARTETIQVLHFRPTVTISGPGEPIFCEGDSLILTASRSNSYLWSTGDTTQSIFVSKGGTYSVTVVDTNGCLCYSQPVIMTEVALPILDLGADAILCAGQTIHINIGNPGASYLWSDGSTGQEFTIDQTGTYYADLFLSPCPVVSDTIEVEYATMPPLSAGGPAKLCPGDSVVITAGSGISYAWVTGETSQSVIARDEGSYFATVTDSNGCVFETDTIEVSHFRPTVTISGPGVPVFCEGDSLTLTASRSESYLWSSGDTTQSIFVRNGGTYSVTVVDTNGCLCYSKPIIMTRISPPVIDLGADTTLCEGEARALSINVPGAIYIWQDWSSEPDYLVTQPGVYHVEVILPPCRVKDTVRIEYTPVVDFIIPNLITPNGDGKNDALEIGNILPGTSLQVYDKWGPMIFNSSNYGNDWQAQGTEEGIYFYHVSNPNRCVKEYQGWLQIVK